MKKHYQVLFKIILNYVNFCQTSVFRLEVVLPLPQEQEEQPPPNILPVTDPILKFDTKDLSLVLIFFPFSNI